ncbi:hypothetical protein ACFL57_03110 [Candidatus Margulisiibacteriota bacterium]
MNMLVNPAGQNGQGSSGLRGKLKSEALKEINVPVNDSIGLNDEVLNQSFTYRQLLTRVPMEKGTYKKSVEELALAYQTGDKGNIQAALGKIFGIDNITPAWMDAFLGNKDHKFNKDDIREMENMNDREVLAHLNTKMKECLGFFLATPEDGKDFAGRFKTSCEAHTVEFTDKGTGVDCETIRDVCGRTWGEVSKHMVFKGIEQSFMAASQLLGFEIPDSQWGIDPNTQLSDKALNWLATYALNKMRHSVEGTRKPGAWQAFIDGKYEWSRIKFTDPGVKERFNDQFKVFLKESAYDIEHILGKKDEAKYSYADVSGENKNGTIVPNRRRELNIENINPKS